LKNLLKITNLFNQKAINKEKTSTKRKEGVAGNKMSNLSRSAIRFGKR